MESEYTPPDVIEAVDKLYERIDEGWFALFSLYLHGEARD